jgi:hypothetical protein
LREHENRPSYTASFFSAPSEYSSPIHHSDSGEKVDEFGSMSLNRVPVFSCRSLLQGRSYRTDGIEPVSSSIPLHAMTDHTNRRQIILLQRGFECLHVTLTIL